MFISSWKSSVLHECSSEFVLPLLNIFITIVLEIIQIRKRTSFCSVVYSLEQDYSWSNAHLTYKDKNKTERGRNGSKNLFLLY